MLLRSSSTPVLGSLLCSVVGSPNHETAATFATIKHHLPMGLYHKKFLTVKAAATFVRLNLTGTWKDSHMLLVMEMKSSLTKLDSQRRFQFGFQPCSSGICQFPLGNRGR
ncbi:hypothetical protein SLEP1_g54364 [Rubroshorea leprosula]|uniref:Secreted protein n=1 Tax=Rubroshorea leprosula TaxID=152421 RepID=A0AAV5MCB5_9ROSI|nr:hypothetical protein SLEP1_g54364 [Rubroshorea leprosula]